MKKQLRGFSDYTDFLSYSSACLNLSDEGYRLLHDNLLTNQDTTDPIMKIREVSAIVYVGLYGEDYYRRSKGEASLAAVKLAMDKPTMDLIGRLLNA